MTDKRGRVERPALVGRTSPPEGTETPRTEAGRDYGRLNELRDAIIEAVQTQDGVGGVKAFGAYDDFLHDEAFAAGRAAAEREARRLLLAELSESPLPGARYAYEVVSSRLEYAATPSVQDETP